MFYAPIRCDLIVYNITYAVHWVSPSMLLETCSYNVASYYHLLENREIFEWSDV